MKELPQNAAKSPGVTRDLLYQTVENHLNIRKLLEIISGPLHQNYHAYPN